MDFSTSTQNDEQFRDDPVPTGNAAWRRIGGPVLEQDDGSRVDGYMGRMFPFFSRASWQKRIDIGHVHVNGRPLKCASRLKTGDLIAMYSPPVEEPEVDRGIRVLWQEGPVVGVYKPANLPMHENGPYRKNTFTEIVWQALGREWSAVHRLDRETSGIVLCGATPEVRSALAVALAKRNVVKQYLAICRGSPEENAWVSDGPIGDLKDSDIRIKKWVVPDGLPSRTLFSVEHTAPGAVLLRARPVTGRTNQIRIHAAHHGHVIFGDKLYHGDDRVFLEYYEKGATEWVNEMTGFPRLCLHATALEFDHPDTKKSCLIECPMPDDMAAFWADLAASPDHSGVSSKGGTAAQLVGLSSSNSATNSPSYGL